MKRGILFFVMACLLRFAVQAADTDTVRVFDRILFYDGYASMEALKDEMVPVPEGVFRLKTSLITTQLTDEQLAQLCGEMRMNITLGAACDNYDRIGHVYIALVPKDSAMYNPDETQRIEIARFITPFMNKNRQPDTVPYIYQTDYLQHILQDEALRSEYNFWIELEIFGVPYSAHIEVTGCKDRNDVFYGTLLFITGGQDAVPENGNVLIPLLTNSSFNN